MDEIRPDYERDMEIYNAVMAFLAMTFGIAVGAFTYWALV